MTCIDKKNESMLFFPPMKLDFKYPEYHYRYRIRETPEYYKPFFICCREFGEISTYMQFWRGNIFSMFVRLWYFPAGGRTQLKGYVSCKNESVLNTNLQCLAVLYQEDQMTCYLLIINTYLDLICMHVLTDWFK